MKNLSLILNAVLFAAVVGLYILFFTTDKDSPKRSVENEVMGETVAAGQAKILYIDIDSVLSTYNMYTELQAELQEKLRTSEAQLASQEKALMKEMEDFQYKYERGLMTRAEAGELQQQLAAKEQSLYKLQNDLQMQLAEEGQVTNNKVLHSIKEYLKRDDVKNKYQYKYVFGNSMAGTILLYTDDYENISDAVTAGLNSQYMESKGE